MNKTILIAAAHPDDEVLGCGGVMAKHAAAGDSVHVVFFADGESSREGGDNDKTAKRERSAQKVAEILGTITPICLGLPDNKLDTMPLLDVIQKIEPIIFKIKPQIIYTHYGHDLNIDHRIVHQAVLTACRPMPGSPVREIYGFEVLSSTDWASPETATGFRPAKYTNIKQYLEQKMAALACYDSEMRPFPHIRSHEAVKALVAYRGASVGMAAAEAFSVIRVLDD
ncbi:MAG: PIG-L family deacetylase [bacterium]|nr:PIG-L family deacetylase [bacterium]